MLEKNDEKWTDVAYAFVKWKLFSDIQVSSTDRYISIVKALGKSVFHLR